MKIAIICNKTGVYEKDKRHSGFHFAWGFEGLGDEVDIFHWQDQEEIELGYDFYMNVDSSESYEIRSNLHPLVVYNGDTHMPGGIERDMLRCKNADLIFNGNYEYGVKLMEMMGKKSIWLPLGFDRRFDFEEDDLDSKYIDVAMAGNPNSPERVALWNFLKTNYKNSEVGDIDSWIYHSAKIVVNQPTMPWDIIYNNRLLEGLASGCYVLQKDIKIHSFEKLFKEGRDYEVWHDLDDLKFKIDLVLQNWDEIEPRCIVARNLTIKNYSYRNLCTIIKNYVLNL